MSAFAVRAERLSKQYRIPRPPAPRWSQYVRDPSLARRTSRTLEVDALRDVSFEVPEGEVFGIIGRNGAGKSTLLKILSRITTPTSGRAAMRGRVASLLEVGTGFHPELTGRENVFLNGMLLGMSARAVDNAFGDICEFAGIGPYIDAPIKRYSSGMQLRLAFAVAAHLAADTMIIDEVLAVGDAEFQRKCLGAVREVTRRGRTTLFVSHNMTAIESLCTRVLWLEKGQVRMTGPTDHVVREYLAAVVGEGQEGPAHIDLRSIARTAATIGLGRIRSIEFGRALPNMPHRAWHVRYGERFSLSISFDLERHVPDMVAGFGVRNDRGEDVLTSHSADTPLAQLMPGQTEGVATVTIGQPWLRPGRYYIEVALLSGNQMLDHVGEAAVLVVEEHSAPGAPPLALKKGAVSPVWEWEFS